MVRFDGKPIETTTLDVMQRAIRHRGPDGEGRHVTPHCALLHSRLSIVDLEGGAQPMIAAGNEKGGALAVVFNGEIYNHRELRAELEKLGHHFQTDHSDTEVLLHGYREWGRGVAARLNGMFAFAIWDEANRRVLLGRDPIGKKPLFYREFSGGAVFASTPSALFAAETVEVDPKALHAYFSLGYPWATLAIGVREVGAGFTCWLAERPMGDGLHWVALQKKNTALQAEQITRQTRELIESAVARRLEADVPLGCFLSGGIDSTIVAALANQALRARGGDSLRTFTVAMPDAEYDESDVAAKIAEKIGSRHTTLRANPSNDLFKDLTHLISLSGEPLADSSILPTYWLCKAAREHVKVALSGDGGDEMFGGYDRYRALRLFQFFPFMCLLPVFNIGTGADGRSKAARYRRLVLAANGGSPAAQYEKLIRIFSEDQLAALAPELPRERTVDFSFPLSDPRDLAMTWDRLNYLPHDVLRKVDRASMAVGLEVRSPLLDREVMTFACSLPASRLMPRGKTKAILRGIASQLVGEEIASLPKRGFGLPIGAWFAEKLHAELRVHLMEGALDQIGLKKKVIAQMLEDHRVRRADHTHRLFTLLALSIWLSTVRPETRRH